MCLDVHSVSWRIGHALTAWRRQQGARHRQRSRGGPGFSNRGGAKRFNMCMQRIYIPAANRLASHRLAVARVSQNGCAFIVLLACVYLRSVCDYFCPRSLVVIITRLSHGDRMVDVRSLAITCHFSATKLIAGRFLKCSNTKFWTHVHLRLLAVTSTLEIAQMPYVWRTFTCVHWR